MAQSALTVTPPNPTPPTNFSCCGVTGPNPPNFTKTQYANPFNLSAIANAGGPALASDQRPQSPYGVNPNPPPYFDDGSAGSAVVFAANTAALASGTGATSGGTENTYPGIGGLTPPSPNQGGAVPASSSVAHEGAGTEVLVTQSYAAGVLVPGVGTSYLPAGGAWTAGDPGGPLRTDSAGQASFTGVANAPNASHASSLSPVTNPALTSAGPSVAAGAGNATVTATGTNFTRQSVIWVNGIAYPTTFVNSTSLTAVAPKKATPGTLPVNVVTGGAVTTVSQNWTFT